MNKTLHFSVVIQAPTARVWDTRRRHGRGDRREPAAAMTGFEAYMNETFPKALARLKALCEALQPPLDSPVPHGPCP